MAEKVLLILVDGMRPEAITACGNPRLARFFADNTSCMDARTVFPSITLPCHMSLFHSVDPERHGVLTNTYVPQNHPIIGLIDALNQYRKSTAVFYTWEPLRDLWRPGSVHCAWYLAWSANKWQNIDRTATEACSAYLTEKSPDFAFLYLGETDEYGHHDGWLSQPYLDCVSRAGDCICDLAERFPSYTIIVTADHGGHNRNHGELLPEDMTIPMCFHGPGFPAGKQLHGVSIKDLAPTIAALTDIEPEEDWEGKSLLPEA